MRKTNKLIIFFFILALIFLSGCQSLRENLSLKKKQTTDEFLVQKKNPLVLPPDYEKLPKPINEKSLKKQQENEIDLSKVFENPEQTNSKNKTDINKSLEESIRKKIGND